MDALAGLRRVTAARRWLAPLGAVFGAARPRCARGSTRAASCARHAPRGPVISVGNLAVGGRGKTPVVARVAALLRDAGQPVAVLSRGYGGSFRGDALLVRDGDGVLAEPRTSPATSR